MKEIRIKVSNDMSKQEEIDIIDKLLVIFQEHPNNYLNTLFSNDFARWVEQRIRNDFPPDAYEHFCGFECDNIKRRLVESDRIVSDYDMRVTGLESKETELVSSIEVLKTEYNKLEKLHETLLIETSDTEYSLRETIKVLEEVIINLKAKLYDKITK